MVMTYFHGHDGVTLSVSHLLDDPVGSPAEVCDWLEVGGIHLKRLITNGDGCLRVQSPRWPKIQEQIMQFSELIINYLYINNSLG